MPPEHKPKPADHHYTAGPHEDDVAKAGDNDVVLREYEKDDHGDVIHSLQEDIVDIYKADGKDPPYVGSHVHPHEPDGYLGPETTARLGELGFDASKGLTKKQIADIHARAHPAPTVVVKPDQPIVPPTPATPDPTVVDQHVDAKIAANGDKPDQVHPVLIGADKLAGVGLVDKTKPNGTRVFKEGIQDGQGDREDISFRSSVDKKGDVKAKADERITYTDGTVTDTQHTSHTNPDGVISKDKGHTTTTTADGDENRFAFKETVNADGTKSVDIYQGRGFLGFGNGKEIAHETISADGKATFELTSAGKRRHFDAGALRTNPQDITATGATSAIAPEGTSVNGEFTTYVDKINTGMGVQSVNTQSPPPTAATPGAGANGLNQSLQNSAQLGQGGGTQGGTPAGKGPGHKSIESIPGRKTVIQMNPMSFH